MPFLESVAHAMGVEALTVISTGVDPPAASQRQWDDGGNALAVDRRRMLCYGATWRPTPGWRRPASR